MVRLHQQALRDRRLCRRGRRRLRLGSDRAAAFQGFGAARQRQQGVLCLGGPGPPPDVCHVGARLHLHVPRHRVRRCEQPEGYIGWDAPPGAAHRHRQARHGLRRGRALGPRGPADDDPPLWSAAAHRHGCVQPGPGHGLVRRRARAGGDRLGRHCCRLRRHPGPLPLPGGASCCDHAADGSYRHRQPSDTVHGSGDQRQPRLEGWFPAPGAGHDGLLVAPLPLPAGDAVRRREAG
mmetsp:Transcript_76488/g.238223  ORF Transcript_76488/g.238223 Transcript_76488/m.238223 type:complete len:236 (-) Transcript_76488:4-711(-)